MPTGSNTTIGLPDEIKNHSAEPGATDNDPHCHAGCFAPVAPACVVSDLRRWAKKMNDRLPELKNFKAIEAEPEKPEQWWKRYYSYFFFMILCMALFAGGEFLRQTGVIGKKPYHLRSPSYTVAESNKIIYRRTIGAAGLGMVVGVIAGFTAEKSRKK